MRALHAALSAALLLMVVGGVLGCSPSAGAQTPDYCRYGSRSSLLLIDRTTPYDANDRQILLESVGAVVDHLQLGERLVVATISAHYSESQSVISACRPGCPDANGPLGDLAGNCSSVLALRDARRFRAQLITALGPVMDNSRDEPFSDITGTIAQATQHPSGGRPFAAVFIFSDMLENSQALPWRQFRDMDAQSALAVVRQYGLTPAVRGAQVRIAGFGRLNDPARSPLPADLDQRVRQFWEAYFAAGGSQPASFEHSFMQ